MKKITLLLTTIMLFAFTWQNMAQSIVYQTFMVTGHDADPTVLTIVPEDITAVPSDADITVMTLDNFVVHYYTETGTTTYCGSWYDFNVDVDGGNIVTGGCDVDINGVDILDFTSINITSNDIDITSDIIYVFVDVAITFTPTTPPSCSALITPADGSLLTDTAGDLAWSVATNGVDGYNLTVGTTSGGSEVLATTDVGNVNTYNVGALVEGTTYFVTVTPYNVIGSAEDCTEASFTTATTPANDLCADAIVLTVGSSSDNIVQTHNIGATDSGETEPGCANYAGGDVWFTAVVPDGGEISFRTIKDEGSVLNDTGAAVYSGDCGALVLVECNDDGGADLFSEITLTDQTPGDVLYFRSWEYGNDVFGTYSVVAFLPPPANDNICDAIELTVDTASAGDAYTTIGATPQEDEVEGPCFSGGINGSVWFTFVAPASGAVSVTTDIEGGTHVDTEIAVYAAPGDCLDFSTMGEALACDQDGGEIITYNSTIKQVAGLTEGDTYYVQVDRWSTADNGTFGIDVTTIDCPAPMELAADVTAVDTATLSWNGYSASLWNMEYGVEDFTPGEGTLIEYLDVTTYDLAGLENGIYDFYVQANCDDVTEWTGPYSWVQALPPANDNICDAIAITIDTPSAGDAYTSAGATAEVGEPEGDCFSGGINGSVWFTFVAPASGQVVVTTDIEGGTHTDTEIAIYAAPGDCTDFSTMDEALACNQDISYSNYMSTVQVLGLTEGDTYYVQVDRWATAADGTFGLEVNTLASAVPDCAENPFPADGAIDVEIDTTDADGDGEPDMALTLTFDFATTGEPATEFYIYLDFDSSFPDGAIGPISLDTPLDLSGVPYGTEIFWKIAPANNLGMNEDCNVWSFTTEVDDTSVADQTIDGFSMFPNPVEDTLNINATNSIDTISVYNLLGQEVLVSTPSATQVQLDTANLPTGAYIVKVQAGDQVASYNLIKQ